MSKITGGQAIVKTLEAFDIKHIFCLAGESFLPTIEALRDSKSIETITNRLEIEAGFAAVAQATLTATPSIAMVTRGPGVCNISIAIHTAQQSSVPLVIFVGQVPLAAKKYEATQYINLEEMFGAITKKVFTPTNPAEMSEMTAQALELSVNGRAGPVIVEMPIDVLQAQQEVDITSPAQINEPIIATEQISQAASLINQAQNPLIIAGERLGFESATEQLIKLAKKTKAGVMTVMRQQDLMPYNHPNYLGTLGLGQPTYITDAFEKADLLIICGHRMNQETTRLFNKDLCKNKKIISIYPDDKTVEHELYPVDIKLISNIKPTLEALIAEEYYNKNTDWIKQSHDKFINHMKSIAGSSKGDVDLGKIVEEIAKNVADDTIIITDAGNFATWPQFVYPFSQPHTQLGPINGSMGYGLPAAIGAKLTYPEKTVIVFVGDGGFMMTGAPSLATALDKDLSFIVILCDNSCFGTIYMHHHNAGNKDMHALKLTNPDFTSLAESYLNVTSYKIDKTEQFAVKFKQALGNKGVSLFHLKTDINDIAAGKHL